MRNAVSHNATTSKIGLMGEAHQRQMAHGAAYRTTVKLKDKSPEIEQLRVIKKKNQNLLEWLRNV